MATATKAGSKKAAKKSKESNAKKAPAKKAAKPSLNGLTAKERMAVVGERPIKWNEERIAVVNAMRKLKAFSMETAKTADKIAEKSGLDVKKVKHHLDVYRGESLAYPAKGYAKAERLEGSRELSYYLTAKGKSADFKS